MKRTHKDNNNNNDMYICLVKCVLRKTYGHCDV